MQTTTEQPQSTSPAITSPITAPPKTEQPSKSVATSAATATSKENPKQAQQQTLDDAEIVRAVVRVSWDLIDAFADEYIDATIPFQTSVNNGQIQGEVKSRADLTIKMQENDQTARFTVSAEGTAKGRFTGSSGIFRLSGPMSVPFKASKAVFFDGRNFQVAEKTHVSASVDVTFSCIRTRRNGPLGKIITRLAEKSIQAQTPATERASQPIATRYLSDYVEQEADGLATQLNQVTAVEASILKVYPQLKDWRVKLSSHETFLEARYAPPTSAPIVLPNHPERPKNAGIEIWIRTTTTEAKFLERFGAWKSTQERLSKILKEASGKHSSLTAKTTITAIDDWLVVAIGRIEEQPAAAVTAQRESVSTEK